MLECNKRLEEEIVQLCVDIRRIGEGPCVRFGDLFDDDFVQNYYEALVGTLKCAKKRGLISFKGQMLLKGVHDNVVIALLGAGEDDEGEVTLTSNDCGTNTEKADPTDYVMPLKSDMLSSTNNKSRQKFKPTTSSFPLRDDDDDNCSVTSYSSAYNHSSDVVTTASRRHVKPKTSSSTKSSYSSYGYSGISKHNYVPSFTPPKRNNYSRSYTMGYTSNSVPAPTNKVARSKSIQHARTEMVDRLEKEIPQLLTDIRRVGVPGEPSVKFGELFDDEEVEQFYEALVGTLKSAKRRGYIEFKGQMLLKGIHDNVLISIKDEC